MNAINHIPLKGCMEAIIVKGLKPDYSNPYANGLWI